MVNIEHVEATAQVLDAISFILVTPEFASKDVLASARTGLTDAAKWVLLTFVNQPDPAAVVLTIIVGSIWFGIPNRRAPGSSPGAPNV
jgi:hypothetical protein